MLDRNVLLLAAEGWDMPDLPHWLFQYSKLTRLQTLGELRDLLRNGEYDALFCAESLRSETWRTVVAEVHKLSPGLPVIIVSRNGGEKEWLEVLAAGAFDLLVPPYGQRQVLSLLEHAASSRMAKDWQKVPPPSAAKAC
ncbi:MAG: hypothetical protein A3H94_05670 [Acidobacteria bacterium RIFCSPLOWO2_02_FULL_60_20]|nr:MAG: hypothetical protein A3H94_05670 [Acidobacteria bacterium RIFCSPLOWO2_02_FULL_60_20]